MAHPNDPRHKKLVAEVDRFLNDRQFVISEKTYHDGHMERRAVERLQVTFSPTALHIRANADRIAINPSTGLALYYEAKTGEGRDICIEALPLADHIHNAKRRVLCLYCCLDRFGNNKGFWCHAMPKIRCVFLPRQRMKIVMDWYSDHLPVMFPDCDIVRLESVRGSGDPFVVIDESIVATMPSWQHLLDEEIASWIDET